MNQVRVRLPLTGLLAAVVLGSIGRTSWRCRRGLALPHLEFNQ